MSTSSKDGNVLRMAILPAGVLTCLAAGLLLLAASISTAVASEHAKKMDIVDTAVGAGNFTTLVKAVQTAGLADTLKGEGPFTVFAPTDEAFAKVPKATLDGLLADKEALTKVLTYHVVAGKVMAADVMKMDSAKTIEGQSVTIDTSGGKVKVNDATVVAADVPASNGVIHAIDTVLIPN